MLPSTQPYRTMEEYTLGSKLRLGPSNREWGCKRRNAVGQRRRTPITRLLQRRCVVLACGVDGVEGVLLHLTVLCRLAPQQHFPRARVRLAAHAPDHISTWSAWVRRSQHGSAGVSQLTRLVTTVPIRISVSVVPTTRPGHILDPRLLDWTGANDAPRNKQSHTHTHTHTHNNNNNNQTKNRAVDEHTETGERRTLETVWWWGWW